jgi:small-conductance mechanosensitive channel
VVEASFVLSAFPAFDEELQHGGALLRLMGVSATLGLTLESPVFLRSLSIGSHDLLSYTFFKIGSLPVTPLFLVKVAVFLFVLVAASNGLQRLLVGRVLRHINIADSQKFALSRFATYLLFCVGLFVGLQSLGVNLNSLVVFGGAVGVGVGLGLQNVVSNFVAGLILLIEQPIRMGDRIETGDTLGDVVRIAARSTWVRTNDNVIIIVPNNEFINNSVTNWTANDPNVRVSLPVGVGYSSDPEEVRKVLLEAAAAHPLVLKEPKPDVIFTDYGDNSINFALRVWTAERAHTPLVLKSDLYFAIFKLFAERGSVICISGRRILRCLMPELRRRRRVDSYFRNCEDLPVKLSIQAAACERRIRRMEEDRPNFLRRIARYGEHEREFALQRFEMSIANAKKELEEILRAEKLD